jgi:hypothetical protein
MIWHILRYFFIWPTTLRTLLADLNRVRFDCCCSIIVEKSFRFQAHTIILCLPEKGHTRSPLQDVSWLHKWSKVFVFWFAPTFTFIVHQPDDEEGPRRSSLYGVLPQSQLEVLTSQQTMLAKYLEYQVQNFMFFWI